MITLGQARAALFAGLLLVAEFTANCAPSFAAQPPNGEKVFVGYLYGDPSDIKYDLYTHLCHAFIVADEFGALKPNQHVPSRKLASEAHKAGVKVLLSLGGWGWDKQFAAIVSDGEAEERYYNAVMRMVDDYDYDGIDLDWEYPDTPDEIVGFERLARRFRTALDQLGKKKSRPMVLTMAASASPQTLKWLDAEFLLETMDWLNIMTYDYAGQWSSHAVHNAPLFASSKVPADDAMSIELTLKYLLNEKKLPADHLAVGLPLYGRGFGVAEPYAPTAGAPAPPRGGGNYARLHQLQANEGWQRSWDDETKTPWLAAPDGSSVIGYDDAESIAIKTEWAMQHGFRGVFFWQIGGDLLPDGSRPLQSAAHKQWKLRQRCGVPAAGRGDGRVDRHRVGI